MTGKCEKCGSDQCWAAIDKRPPCETCRKKEAKERVMTPPRVIEPDIVAPDTVEEKQDYQEPTKKRFQDRSFREGAK